MKDRGNVILITGGSSGIGLALAERFLGLKNKVIITGRNEARLKQVKNDFPELITFCGDVTDEQAMDELVLFIEQHHADLNVLINNAAVQYNYDLADDKEPAGKIEYEIAANLTGPVKLTAFLLPVLMRQGDSAIVNVSSGLFIAPKRTAAVYCATKAAIHTFTKALRYQMEGTCVKVFELIPALVDTPMTAGRGRSKISATQLTDEFIGAFRRDRVEVYIGKTKLLKWISRLSPTLADAIMKNGL